MTPDVRSHPDASALVANLATEFLAVLTSVQADGLIPHVALTGGGIADTFHREVARRASESSVDWAQVEWWWGDERFVRRDSGDRNAMQARRALLDQVDVDPARVHEMEAAGDLSLVAAAHAYTAQLRAHSWVKFDVVLLGIGPDGHVASLFPEHAALDCEDLTVAVPDSPKPPAERVSLTLGTLNRADRTWILASGESKGPAVAALVSSTGSVRDTPARGVHGRLETVLWTDVALP